MRTAFPAACQSCRDAVPLPPKWLPLEADLADAAAAWDGAMRAPPSHPATGVMAEATRQHAPVDAASREAAVLRETSGSLTDERTGALESKLTRKNNSSTSISSSNARAKDLMRQASRIGIAATSAEARLFAVEMVIRLVPLLVLVFLAAYGAGLLFYFAADHLLLQTQDGGANTTWSQPWAENLERKIEDELMNHTFVQFYATIHRDAAQEPLAPKYSSIWIWVYYLRMGLVACMAYGIPWFSLVVFHGWYCMQLYIAALYFPQVLFVMAYCCAASQYLIDTGSLLVADKREMAAGFLLAIGEALVVLPCACRRMGLKHPLKVIILPYLILWISLLVLRYQVPLVMVGLTEMHKVVLRVFVFEMVREIFVGITRLLLRTVPLADEEEVRPEDKTFVVLGVDCLFGYWGRIIMMDMQEPWAIAVCSMAVGFIELVSRVSVVKRDRAYLAALFFSPTKRTEFWRTNEAAMKRFRCSSVITHAVLEYLMIAAAAAFSYASGSVRSEKLGKLIVNISFQVFSEVAVDLVSFYWEIVLHKVPIVTAWNARHDYWVVLFGIFTVGFKLFALSQSGQYFCAVRPPPASAASHLRVILLYCGSPGPVRDH